MQPEHLKNLADIAAQVAILEEANTLIDSLKAQRAALERERDALREALAFYVAICGNTAAVVDRQSALEAYTQARNLLGAYR